MFRQVSCVVHHCGLGTTAAVIKAGIPSIPVPYIVDQFNWAKRIHSLRIAIKTIPRKQLTEEKLAKAITEALGNKGLRNNATKLAGKIQKENGRKRAVEAIEHSIRADK
jgi:UDP:flavonoid glycosyltransferase YjiC (YdhE family)